MQEFTIKVDPGYMFDYLSILNVKLVKKPSEKSSRNYDETVLNVCDQIGFEKYMEIRYSDEYFNLFNINSKLFDLVDEVKRNPHMWACIVDNEVWARFLAKKALQEKFFPEIEQKEQKFDYEQK